MKGSSESAVIVVAYEKKQTTVADAQGPTQRRARGMRQLALFDDTHTCSGNLWKSKAERKGRIRKVLLVHLMEGLVHVLSIKRISTGPKVSQGCEAKGIISYVPPEKCQHG